MQETFFMSKMVGSKTNDEMRKERVLYGYCIGQVWILYR
ncbi:MAG: hypothetical protein JWO58_2070 [Chitinophagaceae bacterium]|nr:hypothetical protein [Chitinophagaceae bacterium]